MQKRCGCVGGIGEIMASWPELPDNPPLQSELAWVRIKRLRVVEAKACGTTREDGERRDALAVS